MSLKKELEALGCEALLVLARSARDTDLAPFVGDVHLHSAFLIARPGAPAQLGFLSPMEREEAAATGLRLLTPEQLEVGRHARRGSSEEELVAEVVATGLSLAEVPPGRIAIGGFPAAGVVHAVAQRLATEGFQLVSGRSVLRRLRKCKSPTHLDQIRRAAAGVEKALRSVAALLAAATVREQELWFEGERLRVGRVRGQVAMELAASGLDQPEGNIVAPGAQGGVPHTAGDDVSVLRPGESLIVDLYPRAGLFADCTRTFCVGEPPTALRVAHDLVLKALRQAHRSCRPGRTGWELQTETCDFFSASGYPTPLHQPGTERGYVHGLGHGVGFELHELPTFREVATSEGTIEVGDVLTLEPGLYEPHPAEGVGFGVRLEDTVLVGADGVSVLTELPYDLDPRRWLVDDERSGTGFDELGE